MNQISSTIIARARKLAALGALSFSIMLVCWVFTGWLLLNELSSTYAYNYEVLSNAGMTNLITAPEVISQRVLMLILFVPMIGAGIVFPILYKAAFELHMITEETEAKDVIQSLRQANYNHV